MNDDLINILGSMTELELESLINSKTKKLSNLKSKKLDLLFQIEQLEIFIQALEKELTAREEEDLDVFIDCDDELTDYDDQERFNPFEENNEKLTDEKMGLLLKFSTLKKELESILNKGDKKWSIKEIK